MNERIIVTFSDETDLNKSQDLLKRIGGSTILNISVNQEDSNIVLVVALENVHFLIDMIARASLEGYINVGQSPSLGELAQRPGPF